MPKYRIFAGLGGGFGGATQVDVRSFKNESDAIDFVYEAACEEYESYGGMHGLMSWEEAREEAETNIDFTEDEGEYENELEIIMEKIYNESRETWLEYSVEEVTDEELAILPIKKIED